MVAACILVIAVMAVFYVIVGYPILLAKFVRRKAPAVRKDLNYRPTVTVVMAVHNGQEFIGTKLDCLLALEYPAELMNILVVSDGSTDATETIVDRYGARGVRLLRKARGGKPAALNLGLQHATGEIVFFTDVRQAIHPEALSHLVANFADPTVGAVTGELRMLDPKRVGEQADMELYWRYELWVRSRHSEIDSLFNTTGCIYAMRRSLTELLPPDTLTDDAVLPLRAFFRGYRVIFDREAVAFDLPTPDGAEYRRKLRTLAGMWQVYIRMPQLFTSANRMRWHFFSHKFGRLILPWANLTAVIATVALPASYFRNFLLLDELALILLAVIDPLVPRHSIFQKLSSPARTFVSMNLAALMSVMVFFVRPEKLWKPSKVRARRVTS